MTTTESVVENNVYNFERYDPYIEKFRALFVPSLEPRIHSYLETFVYGKDREQLSESTGLKRCLQMAGNWREPVDAFSTKWGDEGYLENILSHSIEYLIKDGLVDCFLNSIILNNRLNKVCRDLDGLGVKRDLLRYLTVWNYMNERDYWVENEQRVSMSQQSYESIDNHSDLEVEIGSMFRNYRNNRISKKSLKRRRATEDSTEDLQKNDDFLENYDENYQTRPKPQSSISIDSSIREESKSIVGIRKRSFARTFPCRPSNCPIYRMKNSRHSDWEGKLLKLKISEVCTTMSKCETSKPLQLSILRLPCKSEELIPRIIEADPTLTESISRRKTFQAGIINICTRVNEILGNIDKNEVRRCRLHCDIFSGHLSFRMIERESNGCKVCLLADRVVMNHFETKSRSASRGSSVNQLPRITENENSRESGLSIYESARMIIGDDNSQIIRKSDVNGSLETDSRVGNVLNISETTVESKNLEKLNEFTLNDHSFELSKENGTGLDHERENYEHGERVVEKSDENDFRDETANDSKELTLKESSMPSNGIEDQACICNTSFEAVPDHVTTSAGSNQKTDEIRFPDIETETRKEPSDHSTPVTFDDQPCFCNAIFDVTLDQCVRDTKDNSKEPITEESLIPSMDTIENQECFCSTPIENESNPFDHEAKIVSNQGNFMEYLERGIVPESKSQESSVSAFAPNVRKIREDKNKETCDLKFKLIPANNHEVIKIQSDLTCCRSITNVADVNDEEISHDEIACGCPADCTCINKEILIDQAADCDSQCSCDSSDDPELRESSNRFGNDRHIAEVLNQVPIKKIESLITMSDQALETKSDVINTQSNNKKFEKPAFPNDRQKKSSASLKTVPTKIISRPLKDTGKTTEANNSTQESFQASSLQYPGRDESKNKLSQKAPPIISAKIPRSKGQRINISIELCPESVSSIEKVAKNQSKNRSSLENDLKKIEISGHIETKVLPSLRQLTCQSVERGDSERGVKLSSVKNTNDEWLDRTNARVHSPPRPLESRDYLPVTERTTSARNRNLYGNPIKSVIRLNGKFETRSMCRETRMAKNHETREFRRSIRNNRCCDNNKRGQMNSRRNEELSRSSRISERLSGSIINGHLCHAFSSSSVDRMRHLIKTKLRRILLERDKSTNTPKATLTNKKYRVSVPYGKTERTLFSRKRCRTIWESHSATDSTPTSRSFVSEALTGIPSEKITHLLYSSATKRKISSSNFEPTSSDSGDSKNTDKSIISRWNLRNVRNNETSQLDTKDKCSRLAAGSDFISPKKDIGSEDISCSKKQRSPLTSAMKESQCSYNRQNRKLGGESVRCNFHEILENRSGNNDNSNINVLVKKCNNDFVACSGKLDSSLNSTSRHIYLYEFDDFESSNDKLLKNRCWNRQDCKNLKKVRSSEIHNNEMEKKNVRMNKKVCGNMTGESRSRKSRFTRKQSTTSRSINELKNSSSNTNTINSHQKGFSYLDYDLRSKLAQYVNLCKSVKYSLLKRLRPDDVYEVSGTSISFGDRYKFGDS